MILTTQTRYLDEFYFYENDSIIGEHLRNYGEYTQIELDILLHMLDDTCVVWDIGANIGYHTVAFATKAKHVYSFEPNRKNFELLLKNTKTFNNVTLVNAAVSNKNGFISVGDFDLEVYSNYGNVKVGEGGENVLCIKPDSFSMNKPDFIKIDVEGHELFVLEGCRSILEKNKPVLYLEAHETPDLPVIYELLDQLDYYMYWVMIPNYNHNNFKQNSDDFTMGTFLYSLIATAKTEENKDFCNRMLGPDDTCKKFFERQHA